MSRRALNFGGFIKQNEKIEKDFEKKQQQQQITQTYNCNMI
jgi:hypothetical protein